MILYNNHNIEISIRNHIKGWRSCLALPLFIDWYKTTDWLVIDIFFLCFGLQIEVGSGKTKKH